MPTANDLHVLILGNMSAGKSTLVNALLGNSLMPTANGATTAKIFCLHSKKNFSYKAVRFASAENNFSGHLKQEDISALNQTYSQDTIYLECQFPMIQHYGNSIYLYDTPGPNTITYEHHKNIVNRAIEKFSFTHVLCLLDATRLKTEEENNFIKNFVAHALQVNKQIPCIFVVNKIDEIDESREASIAETIASTCAFLEKQGFDSPVVLPLMAKAAQVLRSLTRRNALTKKETRGAVFFEKLLEDRNGALLHAASLPGQQKEFIRKRIQHYAKTPSWTTSPYYPFFGSVFEKFSGLLQSKTQKFISETGIRTLEVLFEFEILHSDDHA